MKVRLSSFDTQKEYDSKYEWNCFCQGGGSGLVLPSGSFDKIMTGGKPLEALSEGILNTESYTTAFFEAFPKTPSCFIRGEGKTIYDAEEDAWKKYQKIVTCNHEMERRNRTDGYAYCKHCSYSAIVFEPLTKCCKCDKPTSHSTDYKGNYYCKKHSSTKPKNPKPEIWERYLSNRLPRKRKKLLKICAKNNFDSEECTGKIKFTYKLYKVFICNGFRLDILFKKQELEFIKKWKKYGTHKRKYNS